MRAKTQYDVLVIGAGPGGYTAAIRAAQLGLKTAVVEHKHLGGICLNWGCIPTKALLRSAEVYHLVKNADAYGVKADSVSFDSQALVKRSRAISGQLNTGVAFLMKKNGIDVIWGTAQLMGSGKVVVSPAETPAPKGTKSVGEYSAPHIIVATGARPRVLPGLEPDKRLIWTYFEAMTPPAMPETLLILGSGAIGLEFASFYKSFGVDVTVVELLDRVLPAEDPEISALARARFEKQGIKILTQTKVSAVQKNKDSVTVTLTRDQGSQEMLTVHRMLSAAGVVGNSENLGLEALGVHLEKGCIRVDGIGRSSVLGIYAIGDVAGPPMLAHKAEHEAVLCVEALAGKKVESLDRSRIPACTYTFPQIASVGLTEPQARSAGYSLKIGRFPFQANGKALALGETEGMVKTIFDAKTGQLLGAHLIGTEVTELIHSFVVALNLESTEEELMHSIFPHPTLSEALKESVLDAYGRALNI